MKAEYREELIRKKRYLIEKTEEIQLQTERVRGDKGNINTKIDQSVAIHIDEIKKLKAQIEDDEKTLSSKEKEIEMKQQVIAQQEDKIKTVETQIKDLDNDMDFIEMSYQMQKDKADKNEKSKEELIHLFEKLNLLEKQCNNMNEEELERTILDIEKRFKL